MQITRQIRQYWPLTIVTIAVVLGLPFLTSQGERRPGLAGITGHAGGLFAEDDDIQNSIAKNKAGFSRPAGVLPFYGFDGLTLSPPIFKSWWDAKPAAAAAKLHELGANTIVLGQIWKDKEKFIDTVARMRGAGLKVIVQVTDAEDWVDLREDDQGRMRPVPSTFVSGRAGATFAAAKNARVGMFADFILVGGDAMSFANQLQRQKMYQVAKQYFPGKPIVRRYGMELDKAEAMLGAAHPMGGTWDEYRFGPDECDIALVNLGRGVEEGRVGVRVNAALEQLNHIVSIVKSRHNDAGVIVSAQWSDEHLLNSTKTAMWSTKEIDQFVSAVLTSAAVDGLLLRGLGNYAFDLGHPDFAAQRQAFRNAAPALSPGDAAVATSNGVSEDRAPASVTQ